MREKFGNTLVKATVYKWCKENATIFSLDVIRFNIDLSQYIDKYSTLSVTFLLTWQRFTGIFPAALNNDFN